MFLIQLCWVTFFKPVAWKENYFATPLVESGVARCILGRQTFPSSTYGLIAA